MQLMLIYFLSFFFFFFFLLSSFNATDAHLFSLFFLLFLFVSISRDRRWSLRTRWLRR
jgi:hypothetical protein